MEERQREALKRFGLDPDQLIHQDGRYWMTAEQLGTALGYRNPSRAVRTLIDRHHKELRPYIGGLKLVPPSGKGGPQDTTVIDTDGQYRIALLANTPQAAKFRTFVVNMLRALERQEFVHVSQVREWQGRVVAQLEAWHNELLEIRISRHLENSKTLDLRKYREMRRYRDMGLTQKETAKLLDISRDTIKRAEAVTKAEPFEGIVDDAREMFQVPVSASRLALVEGGAA